MRYSPKVLSSKQPLDMDEISELLENKDLEVVGGGTHAEYHGDRFNYIFWYGSIIQRDYGGNASRDDFEAWKIVYRKIEADLGFPYKTDLELPYESED